VVPGSWFLGEGDDIFIADTAGRHDEPGTRNKEPDNKNQELKR
jgi:hypothetical protein